MQAASAAEADFLTPSPQQMHRLQLLGGRHSTVVATGTEPESIPPVHPNTAAGPGFAINAWEAATCTRASQLWGEWARVFSPGAAKDPRTPGLQESVLEQIGS